MTREEVFKILRREKITTHELAVALLALEEKPIALDGEPTVRWTENLVTVPPDGEEVIQVGLHRC